MLLKRQPTKTTRLPRRIWLLPRRLRRKLRRQWNRRKPQRKLPKMARSKPQRKLTRPLQMPKVNLKLKSRPPRPSWLSQRKKQKTKPRRPHLPLLLKPRKSKILLRK